MTQEIVFRKFIAVTQRTGCETFGKGYNYWVEAAFPLKTKIQRESYRHALEQVLSPIDHKALGLDVNLGVEPTSPQLCVHIANELEKSCGQVTVKMIRGDGLITTCTLRGRR